MHWVNSWRVRISIIIFAGSLVTLCAIYFDNRHRKETSIFFPLFSLFAAILITERVAEILSDAFAEEEKKKSRETMASLPSLFAGRNDVVVFPNSNDAQRYCNAVASSAIFVRNTVFSYGEPYTQDNMMYEEWIKTKEESLQSRECNWIEVVSVHLNEADPQKKLMNKALNSKFQYRAYSIDDKSCPLVQMTILEFRGRKEVLFGWPFPDVPHGPVFLTRNERIMEYFEQYFLHCVKISHRVEQQKVEPQEGGQKKA